MPKESGSIDHKLIIEAIERLRKKLLDLSARSNLLSMKHAPTSATYVRVIDEIPDNLYERLNSGKNMQFQALPDSRSKDSIKLNNEKAIKAHAQKHKLNPSYDLPQKSSGEKKHDDSKIQTLMFRNELARRLRILYERHYRRYIRERGINVLNAAFGFVQWYESESSRKERHAPLLLMRLNIERRKNNVFPITSDGDPAISNITFSKRMEKDYGIRLPDFEDEDTPESYFKKVEKILPDRFRVRRWVTVGIFPFQKISMYEDLNPDEWESTNINNLTSHDIIARLFGGRESSNGFPSLQEHDIDQLTLQRKAPGIILDADSSQHSAIVDALGGESFAIQGPPGTGKSQTIVNIISACIAKRKSVLFVAEKQAALDVVAKRLRDRDLGVLLFEPGRKKSAVYEDLKTTWENRNQSLKEQNEKLRSKNPQNEELLKSLAEILSYKKWLSKESSLWGLSYYELIWQYLQARKQNDGNDPYNWPLPPPSKEKMDDYCEFIDRYCDALEQAKDYPHPLGELSNVNPVEADIAILKHEVSDIIRQIKQVPDQYRERLVASFRVATDIFSVFLKFFSPKFRASYESYASAREVLREFDRKYDPQIFFWNPTGDIRGLLKKLGKIRSLDTEKAIAIINRKELESNLQEKDGAFQQFIGKKLGEGKNASAIKANLVFSVVSKGVAGLMSGSRLETIKKSTDAFCRIDKSILDLEKEWVLRTGLTNPIPPGQAIIQSEIVKRKRHIPVRNLIRRANRALLAMKPVWLMSPINVSQLLPRWAKFFDVLIIDEASQMLQEDSLPAIVRAKQIIIVGDREQLPPPPWFNVQEEPDEEDEWQEDSDKSILDLAEEKFSGKRMLRWHYRSRHHSLIAFSNREFYQDRLEVLPSPSESDKTGNLGIEHVHVNGFYKARARINMKEAERVLEETKRCMEETPDLSIAIVAINRTQRDRIQDEFERMADNDSTIQKYLERWSGKLEEFIIKSLENMQGDERDIIIISTVYGPDPKTKKVFQRFGPINTANGHRRLNVLFTRAKRRLLLVSSLASSNIKTTEKSNRGLQVLKAYLEYAASGRLEIGRGEGEPDSDFETMVGEVLSEWGYQPTYQVGVAGYRIDIGVKHKDYKNGYLAGIECDGATFHSSLSARDRDRLRQEQLEALGWRIYRVWSTDWFANPDKETEKMIEWLDERRKTSPMIS